MKGIFLTEDSKQAIEAKIAELEGINTWSNSKMRINNNEIIVAVYKQILASAIILPIEESYEVDNVTIIEKRWMFKNYPNGVIIKHKQDFQ